MKPRMSGIADEARGRAAHRQRVERHHVALEAGLLAGREVEVVHAELARLGEQRVVDVGDVADATCTVWPDVDEPSLQDVVGRRTSPRGRGAWRRTA